MILKPCPFCSKQIPRAIQVCPYCHRDEQGGSVEIDTAAPPVQEDPHYYEQDLAALASEDPFEREQATVRMAQRGVGIVQALIGILSDHNKPGLAGIARVLGKVGDRRAIGALAHAARLGDEELRQASLWALTQFRESEVNPVLIAEAERSTPDVQAYLAYSLGLRQDSRACGVLSRLSRHSNREVAFQALWALGEIPENSSVRALQRQAHAKDALRRRAARLSLQKLGLSVASPWMRRAGWGIAAVLTSGTMLFFFRTSLFP